MLCGAFPQLNQRTLLVRQLFSFLVASTSSKAHVCWLGRNLLKSRAKLNWLWKNKQPPVHYVVTLPWLIYRDPRPSLAWNLAVWLLLRSKVSSPAVSVEQYLSTLVQMLKTVGLFGVSRCWRGGGKAGILHSVSQLSMGGLLKENLVPLVAQEDDHVHLKHLRSLWELAGALLDPRLSKRQKRSMDFRCFSDIIYGWWKWIVLQVPFFLPLKVTS